MKSPLFRDLADKCTTMARIRHWCCWAAFSSQVNWSSFTETLNRHVPRSPESKGWRHQPSCHAALELLWSLWTGGERQTEQLKPL